MLLEAIRLSLQEEEQRKSKPTEGKGKSVERTDSSNTTAKAGSSSGADGGSGAEENTSSGGGLEGMFNFRSLEQMIAGQEARRQRPRLPTEEEGGGGGGDVGKGKGKDGSSSSGGGGGGSNAGNAEDLRSAKGKIVDRS